MSQSVNQNSTTSHMAKSTSLSESTVVSSEYSTLGTRFQRLADETHLPFLEVKLYEKYFLEPKLPERLDSFRVIVQRLEDHRAQTVRVLALCAERELIIAKIFSVIDSYRQRQMTTLQLQTAMLRCLYHHQQLSLGVVEGVRQWREGLTRPYPFTFKGANCLVSILVDCERIDGAHLSSVLPLQLRKYPLCSNVSSISLFSEELDTQGGSSSKHPKAGASPASPSTPKKLSYTGSIPTPGSKRGTSPTKGSQPSTPRGSKKSKSQQQQQQPLSLVERLQVAEAALTDEPALQIEVASELAAISDAGRFVPLLRIPTIVPDCLNGIVVSDREWEQQMRGVVADLKERAEREAAAVQ